MATEQTGASASSVQTWLAQAVQQLKDNCDTDTPELDAQLILCEVLKRDRTQLYAFPEATILEAQTALLQALLARRLNGEPIAYIVGRRDFWNAELIIKPGTLVPRADTEILIEKALELAPLAPAGIIADLGTGSGAIAIAVASEIPERQFLAIEYSATALANAHLNLKAQRADNVALIQSSWLDAVASDSLAMVLSNPPYLAKDDTHLAGLQHEPSEALISGASGLEDIEKIVIDSKRAAKAGAPLIIEHGFEQGDAVRSLFISNRFTDVGTVRDLAGHERVTFGFISTGS